jgi:1-deoxy-D-xylulose-5-phosphate synthase
LTGSKDRRVVAIVGDGALTGGMCWEAMNNIAAGKSRRVIVVVNDNGRSYAPTIGGLAERLTSLRTRPRYERLLASVKRELTGLPTLGRPTYSVLHAAKKVLKDALSPQTLFGDLGIRYLGPIDGHDILALEKALRMAKGVGGPVIVHTVTRKGMDTAQRRRIRLIACMHADRSILEPANRRPTPMLGNGQTSLPVSVRWAVLVAITAAMPGPTGLAAFESGFQPDVRCRDMNNTLLHPLEARPRRHASGGRHLFYVLNRAFDQVMMESHY